MATMKKKTTKKTVKKTVSKKPVDKNGGVGKVRAAAGYKAAAKKPKARGK